MAHEKTVFEYVKSSNILRTIERKVISNIKRMKTRKQLVQMFFCVGLLHASTIDSTSTDNQGKGQKDSRENQCFCQIFHVDSTSTY